MPPAQVILEFQDNGCRLSHWETEKGRWQLRAVRHVAIERLVESQAAGAEAEAPSKDHIESNAARLREALREAGIRAKTALAVVPKQWVTLRVVNLPATDPDEVAEMARFEAERHIPFHVERHVVSHHVLKVEGIEGSRVLIAALDGPPAQEVSKTVEAAGLYLTGLEVSTVALADALLQSQSLDPEADPTVAQIDIGTTTSDITVLNKGMPVFARSVALGTQKLLPDDLSETADAPQEALMGVDLLELYASHDDTPAARWPTRLVHEIRQTHEFARREFQCEGLSRVFVSGPGAQLGGLGPLLESALGLKVEALDAFQNDLEVGPDARLPHPASTYASSAGAVWRDLSHDALRINLLPPQFIASRQRRRQHRTLGVTATLAFILIVCLVGGAYLLTTRREQELEYYRTVVEKNEKREKQISDRRTVVRILRTNASPEDSPLAILNSISSWNDLFDPEDMRVAILTFRYEADKNVEIVGHARELRDLNDFVRKLDESGHFAEVRIESRPPVNAPYGPKSEVIKYKVNCYFEEKDGDED